MCTVCGCDGDGAGVERGDGEKRAIKPHHHHHHHEHGADGALDFGAGAAGVHVPGESQARLIEIEKNILSKNDASAARNRARLAGSRTVAINLMSSPGSGKTTLLVETVNALKDARSIAVIEGDQQTSNDAARIRATGVPAVQVNTGKGCHLDADMVGAALDHMDAPEDGLLFIENVGNLVCPAGFDLGEGARVVLASVTEGEDKPLKYPEMFASADLLIVSKVDLAPHVDCGVDLLIANARKVKPGLPAITTAVTKSGGAAGLADWLDWLLALTAPVSAAAE